MENRPTRDGQLKGRHALITGADSGIGRAVALAFAREGADVAISYLSEDKDAKETERLVTKAGRKAALLPGDIGDNQRLRLFIMFSMCFGRQAKIITVFYPAASPTVQKASWRAYRPPSSVLAFRPQMRPLEEHPRGLARSVD
jgi:NAD(P)-dependent dehydrogenase (short-subunit alcohol dehydrogenase family)